MISPSSVSTAKTTARKLLLVALCLVLALGTICIPLSAAAPQAEAAGSQLVVAIDIGHGKDPQNGVWDPGASANGVVEANANEGIANALAAELRQYKGVKVVFTEQASASRGLRPRIDSAVKQGADIVISIHCNSASAPSANGSEVWVPNTSAYLYNETHVVGKGVGNSVLKKLQALGLSNRGTKTRDCTDGETYPSPGGLCDWYGINYWSRWSGIPGIIIEHGFLTNSSDAAKLGNASWQKKIGIADAQGIAAYYGLSKTSPDEGTTTPTVDMNKTGEAVVTAKAYEDDPVIMGKSTVAAADMVAWFKSKNKTFPSGTYEKYGASSIEDFCNILLEEADAEGVRAEVAFAQAMKETGWLGFGGQVKPEQCNFCGLGALDGGAAGADFSSYGKDGVRIGLRAQMQHLKAYASTDPLNNDCVDPRFKFVTRGSATNVKGLTKKWASSPTYGDDLTRMVNDLLGASSSAGTPTQVKVSLADVPSSLKSGSSLTAYVDGTAKKMTVNGNYGTVEVSGGGTHSIALYESNKSSSNPHEVYPTHMYTWIVTSNGSSYTAKRYYGFDDLLRYAGSSIRVTGNKGIRMITGVSSQAKNALTGDGVLGYTLVETGTLIAWNNRVEEGGLTFDTPGVSRGKAYVEGKQNPVFSTSGDVESYTNVLVGFSTVDQYKGDLAMRPYAVMEDASGNRFTVYGGTVVRSIEYIAKQNADAFSPGTAAYNFIHSIIDACKG